MTKITFNNKTTPFFSILKGKVENHFKESNQHQAGNSKLFIKGLIQVVSAIAIYITLVFFTPTYPFAIALCVLFGLNLAMIGFNIMHEGGHQTFSKHKWLNSVSAYFLNVLGGNSYFWKIKHNVNHHTFTNIEGMDADIDVKPFMRLSEEQPKFWIHRFQHIYWVILYSISYFAWIFYHDFLKYFSGKISPGFGTDKMDRKEHVIFWVTKISYVSIYLVLPIAMLGFLNTLLGFAIIGSVCGLFLSIVFQLAHVVEGTSFPVPETGKINQEWAIHQISTTSNFATNNSIITWMLGGLNYQVEHHLFPRISHVHYPTISKLVKETCEEFNIAYLEYPSVSTAFKAHFTYLKRLGVA